jgi:hypothetical protein
VAGEVLAFEEEVRQVDTVEDHLGIQEVPRVDMALVVERAEDTALVVDRAEDTALVVETVEDTALEEDIRLAEIDLLIRYAKCGI